MECEWLKYTWSVSSGKLGKNAPGGAAACGRAWWHWAAVVRGGWRIVAGRLGVGWGQCSGRPFRGRWRRRDESPASRRSRELTEVLGHSKAQRASLHCPPLTKLSGSDTTDHVGQTRRAEARLESRPGPRSPTALALLPPAPCSTTTTSHTQDARRTCRSELKLLPKPME